MKFFRGFLLFFLILSNYCFSQYLSLDTICAESFCINDICINDSIITMIKNIGNPISKQKLLSSDIEHSEPTRNIYWFGDIEFIEILNTSFEKRIAGIKYEKGMLESSNLDYSPIVFKFYNYPLSSFTLDKIEKLFPNSYKNRARINLSVFVKLNVKTCEKKHQISDIVFEFKKDTLIRFSTNFYLE